LDRARRALRTGGLSMAEGIPKVLLSAPLADAPLWFRLSRRGEEYIRLMRLNSPIGIWLLLWPVLWALWIAGHGHPDQHVLIIFVLGVVVMRSAGCIINDFADRNIDPRVKRTRARPLAARRLSPLEALVLFAVLCACALWLVTRLDPLTVRLSFVGAALTVSYPFVKRFFALPQLYLGISFGGWSVPMAFAAQRDSLPRIAWVLYIAAVIWAAMYDTLYAMVDREDDLQIGVKSSAILFADMDRLAVGALQATMLFALVLAGRDMAFGGWYFAGIVVAALLFLYQQWLIRAREPAACLRAFLNNNYVGMAIFIGILLQYVYAP
ncbi:MAG TPA: 4-hydroxybenzoate octaprenyltransferase, partial [Steroidobacteraceae bacterium]|nr:4-hydroxybenzoate octaprenyltransferase [Steroidobacteraceae bacterium]